MELGETEAVALMRSKAVHAVVVVVTVPCAVALGRSEIGTDALFMALLLPFLAFWVAGVTEVALGVPSVGQAWRQGGWQSHGDIAARVGRILRAGYGVGFVYLDKSELP